MAADWHHRATCRDETPELFFPIGNTGPALLQIDEAKDVCRRCPVLPQCRHWALATQEPHGVWGGLSEDEREDILTGRRRRRSSGAKRSWACFAIAFKGCPCPGGDDRHGTEGGYKHGCRGHGCRAAHAAACAASKRRTAVA